MALKLQSVVVLSGEAFFGSVGKGYRDIQNLAHDLYLVTQYFDVHIIALVRRQDTFIESLYQQSILEGESYSFEEFLGELDIYAYKWDALLDSYRHLFGRDRLHVMAYETACAEGNDPINSFLAIIDPRLQAELAEIVPVNPSLSAKGLQLLRLCNPHLDGKEQEAMRYFFQKLFPKTHGESAKLFSARERENLLRAYTASNQRLFEQYLPDQEASLYTDIHLEKHATEAD